MLVVFRVDASFSIGYGHVMRCLTLANTLRERGAQVLFVCREQDGDLGSVIEKQGFALDRILTNSLDDWEQDAQQTINIVERLSEKPAWLVVDHYGLDNRWESALRQSTSRILVIDDLANRPHDCDILLDQNLVEHMTTRYSSKISPGCGLLLGPKYALLQPVYAEMHNTISPRKGTIKRILVSFGGADVSNLTGRVLSAFLGLNRSDIEADIVIIDNNVHSDSIRAQAAKYRNVHLYGALETLAPLMAKADLAIGAAGVTSWERLCLGLPSVVMTLADNQRPIADGLNKAGLIRWLGYKDEVGESDISRTLDLLFRDGLDEGWSEMCLRAVDGNGVNRVCAAMTIHANTPLYVRQAESRDEALLLNWANDPVTRANAFSEEPILPENHHVWFNKRLNDSAGCRLFVIETADGIPIGQARFELRGDAWEIDYSLDPIFRGRGLGKSLLDTAIGALGTDMQGIILLGKVKSNNLSSQKVFESLGFHTTKSNGPAIEYRRAL